MINKKLRLLHAVGTAFILSLFTGCSLNKPSTKAYEKAEQSESHTTEQSESHTAKLFRDMFITQKEQTEISEMREIMKRFPLKESK